VQGAVRQQLSAFAARSIKFPCYPEKIPCYGCKISLFRCVGIWLQAFELAR